MRLNRRFVITALITVLIAAFLGGYRLPFYIYKPGGADELDPVVEVENGYASDGQMHLVTVRGGQATPIQYLLAKIRPFHEVYPLEDIRPKGISESEYYNAQLHMMESSQEAAVVVAYESAGKKIDIQYEGVYVMNILKGMPAEEVLKPGDRIIKVDEMEIHKSDKLVEYVEGMGADDSITLTIQRDGEKITKQVELAPFPKQKDKVGIGITLVTDRSIEVAPDVKFKSGEIGGPSAGLMFSLEIYDQLTENDITKGYQIAGTGEISYEGEVGRIGGIDKKVVAADDDGCDIFFAPNEGGKKGSNYEVAKKTAEKIGTDMKVVPVDTFQDALDYLKELEPKE
ncbi:SepM family pheromone-processing serine protease [Thalassobacillus pellis]|uniref:SepM family pheromone-processing serine protease n=1 Tax=Thalassobacillus pellis TaxID=748008 RepID=UPI001961E755|nr:SepM family pheromone-processing serine protease [Thalassobacillus pellis]MBM7552870.1 PDZ domain-containing protein [Thalassobacillus pellis]